MVKVTKHRVADGPPLPIRILASVCRAWSHIVPLCSTLEYQRTVRVSDLGRIDSAVSPHILGFRVHFGRSIEPDTEVCSKGKIITQPSISARLAEEDVVEAVVLSFQRLLAYVQREVLYFLEGWSLRHVVCILDNRASKKNIGLKPSFKVPPSSAARSTCPRICRRFVSHPHLSSLLAGTSLSVGHRYCGISGVLHLQ